MKYIPNKLIQVIAVVLIAIRGNALGLSVSAGEAKKFNAITTVNINAEIAQADVILIGKLELIGAEERVAKESVLTSFGYRYYNIRPEEVLKGRLPEECYFINVYFVNYPYGPQPKIENYSYLIFLQKVKPDEDPYRLNPNDIKKGLFYRLVGWKVGNWHAIIALDKEASESRAVKSIASRYGFSIQEKRADFLEAMRYILRKRKAGTPQPKTELSPGAFAMYEAFNFPTEFIFKFTDKEVVYDIRLRIHIDPLGYDIVTDDYIASEGSTSTSLLRVSESEMVNILHLLSTTPEVKYEPMTSVPPYGPGQAGILLYSPSYSQPLISLITNPNTAIVMLFKCIEPLTGETRAVMERSIESFIKTYHESRSKKTIGSGNNK